MKPKRLALAAISSELSSPVDVFICCASYEDRSLSVATNIAQDLVATALVMENVNLRRYVHANAKRLLALFGNKGTIVPISSSSPLTIADGISNALRKRPTGKPQRYLIDITTFTHEGLLILLRLLEIHGQPGDSIKLVYSSASFYGGTEDADVGSRWLSKGVEEVRTVLGYAGKHLPSRKTHLILLVGYEHERATRLIDIIEPHRLSLGYGLSGSETAEKNQDANKYFLQLVQRATLSCREVHTFQIACDDPHLTRNEIIRIVSRKPEFNISLAPMNNKLSTIGAALAARQNQEIQICYAEATLYNYANYSQPGSTCYLLDMPEFCR